MILTLLLGPVIVIILGLLLWDISSRFHPGYRACSKINSLTRFPIIGNVAEILNLNPGELYKNKFTHFYFLIK